MLQILFAILAGILTIGTPCVLPVLPIILGSSVGKDSKTRPLFIAFGFVASFAGVSILLSVFTRILGLSQSQIRDVGIILLVIFGIFLLAPNLFEKIMYNLHPAINKTAALQNKFSGNLGGFVTGLTIGIIWAPCAGPVLGAILTLIATSRDLASGAILLVFFALGAGIPMLLIAYGGQYVTTKIKTLAKFTGILQKLFGILVLGLAVAMLFNYDVLLAAKISQYFPKLTNPKY